MAPPDEAGLLAAEASRRQAMQANDALALGALLSASLAYTHSTGICDSRASYLHKIGSGLLRYGEVSFVDPQCRVIGTAGWVTATMRATVFAPDGSQRQVASTYLAVWEHGAGGWVLQVVQATALAAVKT